MRFVTRPVHLETQECFSLFWLIEEPQCCDHIVAVTAGFHSNHTVINIPLQDPDAPAMTTSRFPFERERAPFRAVVCTVVPEAVALGETQWLDVEDVIASGLAHKPSRIAMQLRVFLVLIELLPAVRYGRRFSRLTPAHRGTFCSSLELSKVRLFRKGFWGLRTIALLGYYARPGAAEEVGYRASPLGWQARDPARVQT